MADGVLAHLRMLQGDCGGFAVDRLEHCLQTATRAHRDGRDEQYFVCAQSHWMVEHAIFQGCYFFHHLGLDRNMREEFREHPWYAATEEFCRLYDGPAFDPRFASMQLEEFEPMLRRVFATVKNSIYVPQAATAR